MVAQSPSAKRKSASLETVLPLIGLDFGLADGKDKEPLGTDFFVTNHSSVSGLSVFSDEHLRSEFSDAAWSRISTTSLYLGVSAKFPKDSDPHIAFNKCNERLDRFLFSLNLNGKLWTFAPDARFAWIRNDAPKNRQFLTIRRASPISTFDNSPGLSDFRDAARLLRKIDKIYEAANNNTYPAIATAFAALRLSFYAFNTSMRFLQLAIALEALCSTSTTEISHRLASTCSILMGSDAERRKQLYRTTKQLYGMRSRIIHGTGKRVTLSDVQEMERLTCRVLRRILETNILPNFESRGKQEEFLLELNLERKL
jgi:hypothetical protein